MKRFLKQFLIASLIASPIASRAMADHNVKVQYQFTSMGVTQLGKAFRINTALGAEVQGEYDLGNRFFLAAHYSVTMADFSNLVLYGYGFGGRYLVLGNNASFIDQGMNEYSYSPTYNIGFVFGMLRRDFDLGYYDSTDYGKIPDGQKFITQGDFWAPYAGIEINTALFGNFRANLGTRFGYALFGELQEVKINMLNVYAGIEVPL